MEWQSILSGSFSNPEMARKAIEEKRLRASGELEELDEQIKKTASAQLRHGTPQPDPEIQERILRGMKSDDIMSLSEIAEEETNAGD